MISPSWLEFGTRRRPAPNSGTVSRYLNPPPSTPTTVPFIDFSEGSIMQRPLVSLTSAHLASALSLSLVVFLVGCGGEEGPPRESVSGAVMLDGRPLEKGLITFTPEAGGDLIVSGLVVDGEFSLPRAEGPGLGAHRVDVWSKKATGKTLKNRDDPENPVAETVEIVPSRYNLRSQLKADVVQGGGNHFAYELTGGKEKEPTKRLASRRP